MPKRKRKKRKNKKKRFDSVAIKSKSKPVVLIRNLTYSYRIVEIDKKIHLVVANNKGATFMFIYSGVDRCVDTRDNKILNHSATRSELIRLLGDVGIEAHRTAAFRSAVL